MPTDSVKRWLSEFKTLAEPEWNSYAFNIQQDKELQEDLESVFQGDLTAEVIDPVCHQLFNFYRSMNKELQRFTLCLVPALIGSYLTALVGKERFGSIEACLLGIYNLNVVNNDGKPKVSSTTIPTLACSSIYHEPPSLASLVLTESALRHYHSDRPSVITIGPYPPVHCLNSQNRLPVLTFIMNRYNANINFLPASSHLTLCKMCSRLAKAGFEKLQEPAPSSSKLNGSGFRIKHGVSFVEELRIPLNSEFLLELLQALYYIMFNSEAKWAINAFEDIHLRASYDLLSDVLMVTNAVRNSLRLGGLEEAKDRTMGISVAVSPSRANPIFSKDAITNASFKARKLPEDIDVPEGSLPDETLIPKERPEVGDTGLASQATTERSKLMPMKANKAPIKSIMKKRDEKLKEKMARKDPESALKQSVHLKDTYELHPSKSPRHSTASAMNGDVCALGSRVMFEQVDGQIGAKLETNSFGEQLPQYDVSDARVASGNSEELEMLELDSESSNLFHNIGSGIILEGHDVEN